MENDTKVFGFWLYLMTDLVIFAVLFATFLVLHNSTFGGPSGHQLFQFPIIISETFLLLTSTFTCSLAMLAVHRLQKRAAMIWFFVTFLLGAGFLWLELYEFAEFVSQGNSWKRSGFLSSFFALVGTHGLHIAIGLIWMIEAMFRIGLRPLDSHNISRLFRLALFWHFLDIVWIFIFTIVYGIGYI